MILFANDGYLSLEARHDVLKLWIHFINRCLAKAALLIFEVWHVAWQVLELMYVVTMRRRSTEIVLVYLLVKLAEDVEELAS